MENETFEIEMSSALYGTHQSIVESMSIHRHSGFYLGPVHTNSVYSIEFEVIWFQLSTQIRKSVGSKKNKSKTIQYKTKTLWKWFQEDVASMSGFTDFVWTEGRFGLTKKIWIQEYPDSCDHGLT